MHADFSTYWDQKQLLASAERVVALVGATHLTLVSLCKTLSSTSAGYVNAQWLIRIKSFKTFLPHLALDLCQTSPRPNTFKPWLLGMVLMQPTPNSTLMGSTPTLGELGLLLTWRKDGRSSS